MRVRWRLALAWVALWCSCSLVRAEHLGEWERTLDGLLEPVDAAYVGEELWVLERVTGRLVVFDAAGNALRSITGRTEPPMPLDRPNAFAIAGERVYRARISGRPSFTASPVASDGRLYFAAEGGAVHVDARSLPEPTPVRGLGRWSPARARS